MPQRPASASANHAAEQRGGAISEIGSTTEKTYRKRTGAKLGNVFK